MWSPRKSEGVVWGIVFLHNLQLRNVLRIQVFKRQESNSQNNRKSKYLIIMFVFPQIYVLQIKVVSGNCTLSKLPAQFSSVIQLCPNICNLMDCYLPVFPVHHQLSELAQTHVHRVGDAIQPSYTLPSPSPSLNLSKHQGLLQRVSSSHQVAKVLEFQLLHQSFQ